MGIDGIYDLHNSLTLAQYYCQKGIVWIWLEREAGGFLIYN